MSGYDLVFYKAVADYVMGDIDRAFPKLRERSTEMSDFVEAGLAKQTDSSEARQAQKECAQRLNSHAEELATALDSLKQAFGEICKTGVNAETLVLATVDQGVVMTSHDLEADLEASTTTIIKLSKLQERNKTYDVVNCAPGFGMVVGPVVVGGLDGSNTKWDQGLSGMLRVISEAADRLGKVTGIHVDYMVVCDETMTRARGVAAVISAESPVRGIQRGCDT